jgi:hypothetical protein
MSKPLADILSRFTPDGASLDRDTLLLAAGRASARPNRRWQVLAGALAVCQLLTLMGLWPKTPTARIEPPPVAVRPSEQPAPPPARDPSELGMLSERLLASDGNWVPPAEEGPMIAPEPPLRALDPPPAKYLN